MEKEIKMLAYGRVSDKSQNEERQLNAFYEFGIAEKDIYIDKVSGKDFNREQYIILKKLLRKDSLLVIKSIDRLGRDYNMIIEEWRKITKDIGADIVVLDMPLLDTRHNKDLLGTFVSDLVLQVLSYASNQERDWIKKRQAEGISNALKKGIRFGRKPLEKSMIDDSFYKLYAKYKNKQINLSELAKLAGCCRNTCYNRIKIIEE